MLLLSTPGHTGAAHGSGIQQFVTGAFPRSQQQQRSIGGLQHSHCIPGGGAIGGDGGGSAGGSGGESGDGEMGDALLSEEGRRGQRRQGEGQQHCHDKRYVHADAQSKIDSAGTAPVAPVRAPQNEKAGRTIAAKTL